MPRSIRLLYRNVQGRMRCNYNWDAITARSAVLVTAAEFNGGRPDSYGIPPISVVGRPLLGEANVYVTNIGPHDPEGGAGGVEFHLHVEWPSPLNVMVTITDLGDVEAFVEA